MQLWMTQHKSRSVCASDDKWLKETSTEKRALRVARVLLRIVHCSNGHAISEFPHIAILDLQPQGGGSIAVTSHSIQPIHVHAVHIGSTPFLLLVWELPKPWMEITAPSTQQPLGSQDKSAVWRHVGQKSALSHGLS